MSLVIQANNIINSRSDEKERQYGPLIQGMEAANIIAKCIQDNVDEYSNDNDKNLQSFRQLYGLKLSRQKYNHKEDNLLDAIAYRIGEINALRIIQGNESLTVESFNDMYKSVDFWAISDANYNCNIINQLTQLDASGDDIHKLYLSIEMLNEAKAIKDQNFNLRIESILKQIRIMDIMNDFNNDLT